MLVLPTPKLQPTADTVLCPHFVTQFINEKNSRNLFINPKDDATFTKLIPFSAAHESTLDF